jgi:isocitrate/isopropylmalate dehydrogenase
MAIALRKELGLYINTPPIRSFPSAQSRHQNVDIVIFRENSE